jgi:outer membrane protein assembly factor BamB
MGSVYKAFDSKTERVCALKEMLDAGDPADRAQRVAQFQQEARVLANLHHPGIVTVWDYFEAGGRYYLAEEFLGRGTLGQFEVPLPEADVVRIATEVTEALAYIHERGMVYRDMKPDNVLLRQDGRAVLADFGIVRFFKPGKKGDTTRFASVGYAPPEQFATSIQTSPASDIYAFGATLYRILSGKEPQEWMKPGIPWASFPPLGQVRAELSPALVNIVERCLRLKVAERFPDGRAVLAELRPLQQAFQAARCSCGHQNRLGSRHCSICCRSLVAIQAWQSAYPGPFRLHGQPPFELAWKAGLCEQVRGSPVLSGGLIYVSTEGGNLYTLDLEGKAVGKQQLGAPSRSSPVVLDGQVWVGTARGLVSPAGLIPMGEVFAPPKVEGDQVYTLTKQGAVVCLGKDGQLRWQQQVGGEGVVSPVVLGQQVVVLTKEGDLHAFNHEGNPAWKAALGVRVYGSPIPAQDRLVLLDAQGKLHLINATNGQSLLRTPVVGQTYCGLASSPNQWIAADQNGVVVCLKGDFFEVWRVGVQSGLIATPSVIGSQLLVATRTGKLVLLDLDSGRQRQQIELEDEMVAPWIADGNALFGISRAGVVYSFVGS